MFLCRNYIGFTFPQVWGPDWASPEPRNKSGAGDTCFFIQWIRVGIFDTSRDTLKYPFPLPIIKRDVLKYSRDVLKYSLGVPKYSLGVLKYSLGVLKYSLEVPKYSLEVLKYSLEVLKYPPPLRKYPSGVESEEAGKRWDRSDRSQRSDR
jgi:hypothetical protein